MSGWRTDAVPRSAALRLQRRYRQNVHAVGPLVRRARKTDYNRQGLRRMSASFGYAPLDIKKMILARMIERITVDRDYNIEIHFFVTVEDFDGKVASAS